MAEMRMMARRSFVRLGLATLAGCCTLTFASGCSGVDAEGIGRATNVALVLGCGVCANRPGMDRLPDGATDLLVEVMESGGSLGVVSVEGTPRSFGMERLGSAAETEVRRTRDNEEALSAFASQIASGAFAAVTPEADVLGAIGLAARSLSSTGSEGDRRCLVVCDSMVGTVPPMDFTGSMSLMADPVEVVAYLSALDACPDLAGIDVLVFFSGDVAGFQEPLTDEERANLEEIWLRTLEEGCGADSVAFMPDVLTDAAAPAGLPEVSVVETGEPAPFQGVALAVGQAVALGAAERVGFRPDSDAFVDEFQAQDVLDELAGRIDAAGVSVAVEGNTATPVGTDTEDGARELSLRRAQRVADMLVEGGVDPGRIVSVTGNGSGGGVFSEHTPDLDASGSLIPSAAQQNRYTVVAVVDGGES